MTKDGKQWWRFWADVFVFAHEWCPYEPTLTDYWLDRLSTMLTPCNELWPLVYNRRHRPSNDNYMSWRDMPDRTPSGD